MAKRVGKNTAPKEKRGRPMWEATETHLKQIKALASAKLSVPVIAAMLDIDKATLERAVRRDHRVKAALHKGRAVCVGQVQAKIYENAVIKNNVAAQIYLMKILGGPEWREKTVTSHEVEPGSRLQELLALTSEQRQQKIRDLERLLKKTRR